jgi:S-adenosylmethionine hydrolase
MADARRPVITLLTDFGTRDHYVAAMKGSILAIAPDAALVDVTHDIPPHDILEGAWVLLNASRGFPAGSVHLAVVDPGVGGERRALALECAGRIFVGPDNGLFSYVIDGARPGWMVSLDAPWLRRDGISPVFHGRDLFGPAAAHLAAGMEPARLGSPAADPVRLPVARPIPQADGTVRATVAHVDRFGNVILYAAAADFPGPMKARAGGSTIDRFVATYADARPGEPAVLINSSGFLEIGASQARAADLLGLRPGDPVDLIPAAP